MKYFLVRAQRRQFRSTIEAGSRREVPHDSVEGGKEGGKVAEGGGGGRQETGGRAPAS